MMTNRFVMSGAARFAERHCLYGLGDSGALDAHGRRDSELLDFLVGHRNDSEARQ
jgi:hypothetical protein